MNWICRRKRTLMTTIPSSNPTATSFASLRNATHHARSECIAEGILESVCIVIPDLDRPILAATDDNREIGMKDRKRRGYWYDPP